MWRSIRNFLHFPDLFLPSTINYLLYPHIRLRSDWLNKFQFTLNKLTLKIRHLGDIRPNESTFSWWNWNWFCRPNSWRVSIIQIDTFNKLKKKKKWKTCISQLSKTHFLFIYIPNYCRLSSVNKDDFLAKVNNASTSFSYRRVLGMQHKNQ